MSIHILKLHKIIRETPDAVSLHFLQSSVDRIHFLPGQFITLKVKVGTAFYFRSYSICSAPRLDDVLSIVVKRVPGGLVSNHIFQHFQAGQWVEFLAPHGRFIVNNSIKNQRRMVLIGGGSGITPLMSILRSTLYNEPKSQLSLLYANRDVDHIIFLEQLTQLSQIFGKRLDIQHVLSRQEAETDISYLPGRISEKVLQDFVSQLGNDLPLHFYLCGPSGLMETAYEGLLNLGISEDVIFQERFVAGEEEYAAQEGFEGPSIEVEVHWGEESYNILVPPGSTVLRSAIDQGISLPHSCLRGICASCMGKLEAGEVSMLNNETLLDFEVEAGKVLVCQSQPKGPGVQIRMGAEPK